MGAHLTFKLVNPDKTEEVNKFIENLEEQQILKENVEGYLPVNFWTEKIAQRNPAINKGEGDIKTSSCPNYTKYRHLVVEIFEKLHKRFDIKVLSSSCSLTEHYFTPKQIQTITKNGKALSGDEKERVLNIIEKSTELFSQPLFSTSFSVMQRGLDFLDRSRS